MNSALFNNLKEQHLKIVLEETIITAGRIYLGDPMTETVYEMETSTTSYFLRSLILSYCN